jgi:hypothetical protein
VKIIRSKFSVVFFFITQMCGGAHVWKKEWDAAREEERADRYAQRACAHMCGPTAIDHTVASERAPVNSRPV